MSVQSGDALAVSCLNLGMARGGTRCGIAIPATSRAIVSTKFNRGKTGLATVFSTDFARHVL